MRVNKCIVVIGLNLIILCFAALEATALYQQVLKKECSIVGIPNTSKKPVIDGKFNASEWQNATQLTAWIDAILGVANDDTTIVYTAHDAKNLYVCFRWPIPEEFLKNRTKYIGTPLKRSTEKHQVDKKSILNDDNFSLNISTKKGNFYFAVNGKGAVYDAKNGDASWNSDWQYGMSEDDKFWTMELKVPFISISNDSTIREFGINFGHQAFHINEIDSIWAFAGKTSFPLAQAIMTDSTPFLKIGKFNDPSSGKLLIKGKIISQQAENLKIFFGVNIPTYRQLNSKREKIKQPKKKADKGFTLQKNIRVIPGKPAKINFNMQLKDKMAGINYLRIENQRGQILFCQRIPFAYSSSHSVKLKCIPSMNMVLVDINLASIGCLKKSPNGTLKIISLNPKSLKNKVIKELKIKSFDTVKKTIDLNIDKLPIGKYEVQFLLIIGKKASLISDKFEKKNIPEWSNNKIGNEDTVPAPWTPIKIVKNKIKVWGRSYEFGKSLLPSQIYSQGKQLLTDPINFKIFRDGIQEPISAIKTVIKKLKKEKAIIKSTGITANLKIESEALLEFDGFNWYKITVRPRAKKATINELILEIPFSKKLAKLWYSGKYRPDSPTGYLPQKHYKSKPANFVRIGNANVGMQWCWQSLRGWRLNNPEQAMEFIPEANKYTVRFHIIDHKIDITKPLSFSFGLQALPARPINPSPFRQTWWGAKPGKRASGFDKVGLYNRGWSPQLNYLNLSEKFQNKRRVRSKREWENSRFITTYYLNNRATDARLTEYKYFQEEWRSAPSNRPNNKGKSTKLTGQKNYIMAPVCYGSKNYLNFYIYYLNKFMKEMTKDSSAPIGLYFDVSAVVSCQNSFHGCGYIDSNGKRQSEIQILAWREAMKRIYRVTKKYGQKNWITCHMSGQPHMAYLSFADILIPGEQFVAYFNMKKAQEKLWPYNYTKMLSLSRMRAEFTPYVWGGGHVFLSEIWHFAKGQPKEVKQPAAEHFFGICFVHDTMTWGAEWAKEKVLKALNDHFPWNDQVVFHPYWNNQSLISMKKYDKDKIVASLFTNHKNNEYYLMVFAFNDTDKEVFTEIKLNLNKLNTTKYKNGILWDPLSGKKFNLSDGKGNITIPARNFRMLFLKK